MDSKVENKKSLDQNTECVEVKRSRPILLREIKNNAVNNDLNNIIDNTKNTTVEKTEQVKQKSEAHIVDSEKIKIIFTAILNKYVNGKRKIAVNDVIGLISLAVTLVSKTMAEIPEGEDFDEDEIVEIIFDILKPTNDILYKHKYISKDTYNKFADDIELLELIEPLIVNFLSISSHIVGVFANKKMWKRLCCC